MHSHPPSALEAPGSQTLHPWGLSAPSHEGTCREGIAGRPEPADVTSARTPCVMRYTYLPRHGWACRVLIQMLPLQRDIITNTRTPKLSAGTRSQRRALKYNCTE